MKVSNVRISDIEDNSLSGGYIVRGRDSDGAGVVLQFSKQWSERITVLRRGSSISLEGMIVTVRANFVRFDSCELVVN
jgi:hypothetical protein